MRSQASKSSPKKGVVKPSLKIKPPTKKPVTPNKKKLVNKSLVKGVKKIAPKDDSKSNNDGSTAEDKKENSPDIVKAGPSKVSSPHTDSSSKKAKKDPKDKKDSIKNSPESNAKKVISKKSPKKAKNKKASAKRAGKNIDVTNKIGKNVIKKTKTKYSKAKIVVKSGKVSTSNQKKKSTPQSKPEPEKEEIVGTNLTISKEVTCNDNTNNCKSDEEKENPTRVSEKNNEKTSKEEENRENQSTSSASSCKSIDVTPVKVPPMKKPETPKTEMERPPKFFTSSRSPRMVDIDVKCLKNSKGNLSVSERFLSMKCESKSDDSNKNKPVQNTLVSQGPEIDVYTFTEKVDSPKSILSDFRSSVNKNIGRVRPIARVKGTVVDKTTEIEKKKYSPHRPIEAVVQQLMANKCTEEVTSSQSSVDLSSKNCDTKEPDDAPKAIVSKSYKMVARKSSVTGKPFSPIKFLDQEPPQSDENKPSAKASSPTKKIPIKMKKEPKISSSDDEFDTSKFSLNTKAFHYSSSEESINDSNDESKESSGSDTSKNKKTKNKRYRKVMDSAKKTTSKELKELSKDSLVDLKEEDLLLLGNEKPSKRRRKLLSMWNGPKKHRMASLNAIAKVHCLYENESRTHMELGLMRTVERAPMPSTSKQLVASKKKEAKTKEPEKHETTSESEYESKQEKKDDSSESSDDSPPQRTLRGVPGIRSAGKYWDPKSCTSSSEESELESKKKISPEKKKIVKSTSSSAKSDSDKPPAKMKKTAGVPVKKKRNRTEVVMDLKDMVVQKRMASLNATAILAASYEKRSPKSNKDETTSDSCSDESFSQKPKNGVASGVKSETKIEEPKKEKDVEDNALPDKKQKVEVIVNQDTDVTITGVYSTHHHEGFCTVSGMQYRISSTSHTQTTATANCEKEGCPREDGARYTPLSALSSMQPPADHAHSHPHPVPELGGLSRRAGCSSAFSAPSPSAHHDPGKPACSLCDDGTPLPYGYYQPAGPLIKEGSADERALARYHLPHHHGPHPPVLPQYGSYYPDFCYGRYYRPPGPYHMPPPQGEGPMGGLGNEPYPPPQYYGTPPPCYQHSPQRIPYVEYRGCPCPLNACPKNVLIGPATGKAPTGGGPDVPSALATPGGAFRAKVRASALDAVADTHGSGKDPPLEPEPPAAADAPHPCPVPAIGGASPKREMFDVHDNLRIASDVRAGEAIGPPSPARGSDGACAPQPPSSAPRRARLGKAMARRSLAGDDTNLLLLVTPPAPPPAHHSDADDDVMAISPPLSVPIDLSSSDERSTPLVDIKKENEGPTFATARKPEAQALREHNSARATTDGTIASEATKPAKRRYSRTKLEIDMKDTQLEEGCKTNGIGEHVKLIKRRKVSGDQTEPPRVETVSKEPKKKIAQPKKTPKSPPAEKKTTKRKLENTTAGPRAKKIFLESPSDENPRVGNGVQILNGLPAIKDKDDLSPQKPKIKSALLLDNLLRKNSIDRAPEKEPNPAELFLSPIENIAQNCAKKMLNINNNIVENANTVSGVRPDTIAAVSQLIGKKLAYKNACKLDKVDSKVTHNVKSVLKTPTVKSNLKEVRKTINKCDAKQDPKSHGTIEKDAPKPPTVAIKNDERRDISKQKATAESSEEKPPKHVPKPTVAKRKSKDEVPATTPTSKESQKVELERAIVAAETVAESAKTKRCKLASEIKAKNVEKVIKLLVSKRPVIKTDEATLVVEEACASPVPFSARRSKRRGARRGRRPLALTTLPTLELRAPPRWSNGWHWEGEHYLAKVYLNNDSRLDRFARCFPRMWHASGDKVSRGDCVLLRPSTARAEPFVARVASLWENQDDGEMMLSLVWYYRPEHTDGGRLAEDAPDEVFASRHRDANSVACIEDKCYVLTFNEYCRYRKRLKAAEEGVTITPTIVPPLPPSEIHPMFAPNDSKLPPSVSPELVMFCRKVYDFRSKKIHVPNK